LFSKTKMIESVRALSQMHQLIPEKINPEVLPESKNANSDYIKVNLVFNVEEK